MLRAEQVEELISLVSTLNRVSLIEQFRTYPAQFAVDFTSDFLENQPLDRLRHIFVALCLQTRKMPLVETADAV